MVLFNLYKQVLISLCLVIDVGQVVCVCVCMRVYVMCTKEIQLSCVCSQMRQNCPASALGVKPNCYFVKCNLQGQSTASSHYSTYAILCHTEAHSSRAQLITVNVPRKSFMNLSLNKAKSQGFYHFNYFFIFEIESCSVTHAGRQLLIIHLGLQA